MTWKHIEINAGVQVGRAKASGSEGARIDFSDIGQIGFWVDAVEADGGQIKLHEGRSYEDAIIAAEEMAREEGLAVDDRVARASHGQAWRNRMKAPIFLSPHEHRHGHANAIARDLAAMPDFISQHLRFDHELHQERLKLEKHGLADAQVEKQLDAFADLINAELIRLDRNNVKVEARGLAHRDHHMDRIIGEVLLYGKTDRERIVACLWIAASLAARSNAVTVGELTKMLKKAHVEAAAIIPDKETKGSS